MPSGNCRARAVKKSVWLLLAFLSTLLLAATPSHAARVDARERAAKKACLTGDASRGVEILADLYIDTNDANYIFNQARCYEQNNRYEDAIGRFREYLRKATEASGAEKANAEKHITDLQALLGKKDVQPSQPTPPAPETPRPAATPVSGPPPAPPPSASLPPPVSAPPANIEPPVVVSQPAAQAVPASGGSGLRLTGIIALSVGAIALVGGAVANLKYNSMVGDMQRAYDPKVDDSAGTYHTLSIAGYGVGAACLAGGALFYYVGWRAGQVALVPVAVSGGGAAILTGAF